MENKYIEEHFDILAEHQNKVIHFNRVKNTYFRKSTLHGQFTVEAITNGNKVD